MLKEEQRRLVDSRDGLYIVSAFGLWYDDVWTET